MSDTTQLTLLDFLDAAHADAGKTDHDIQKEFDRAVHDSLPYRDAPRIYSITTSEDGTHHLFWETRTAKEWQRFFAEMEFNEKLHGIVGVIAKKLGIPQDRLADVQIVDITDLDGTD